MFIQQMHREQKVVTAPDGRALYTNVVVPTTDNELLTHDDREYKTVGNGVFEVPDDLGAELVGGLFREVGGADSAEHVRARVELANAATVPPSASAPAPEAETATEEGEEPTEASEEPEEPTEPHEAKKATATKKAAKKAPATKKAPPRA